MRSSVLIVEDEADVVDLLRYNLTRAGYEVLIARNGIDGVTLAQKHRPDVVILDLMLPVMDGHSVCKTLKGNAETADLGILMLTAKGEAEERVKGLELGADDYVTKPFSPRELVLRVEALVRRMHAVTRTDLIDLDMFRIDKRNFEVRLDGERLDLTTTEFKLLALLVERRGRTQSREVLLQDVLGYQNAVDTRTVDTHMRRLREKLGDYASRIETIRGEGYRFRVVESN